MDKTIQSAGVDDNEDDVVEERNYCDMTLHAFSDPLSMLTSDQLSGFQYTGSWQKFDSLQLFPSGDDKLGAAAHINDSKLPIKRRIVREHLDGLIGLAYAVDKTFPLFNWKCPYCRVDLLGSQLDNKEEDVYYKWRALEYCPNCHYWRWHDAELEFYEEGLEHKYESMLSKVREFDNTLPEGFTQEVAAWIRRDEKRWHTITPTSLEKLIAEIFRHNFHPCEAIHVGKPGDEGIDVLFMDSGQRQWLVQVKRREKPECTEPVETIRSLLGTMVLKDSSYGMIVSTADHFTYRAYEAINKAHSKGMKIELIDRGKLNRMLDSVLPYRPWLNILRERCPEDAEYFADAIQVPDPNQLILPYT